MVSVLSNVENPKPGDLYLLAELLQFQKLEYADLMRVGNQPKRPKPHKARGELSKSGLTPAKPIAVDCHCFLTGSFNSFSDVARFVFCFWASDGF
jgi:hypothetical protein